MSPTFSFIFLFILFDLLQAVQNVKLEDGMFVYDAIRMRDDSRLFVDPSADHSTDKVKKRKKRPNRGDGGGGSRYLRRNRPSRKPGKKNLNKSNLLEIMGEDYKTTWMSDEKPKKMFNVPSDEINLDSEPQWAYQRNLAQLNDEYNVTAELTEMAPELLPFESQVRSWLLKRTTCPIEFSWKDLGPTYWPRYIRKGECVNREGFCSFPKGMHCVPGYTSTVHILLWVCNERKNRRRRGAPGHSSSVLYKNRVPPLTPSTQIKKKKKKCEWKKVPHPITVDCFCTC